MKSDDSSADAISMTLMQTVLKVANRLLTQINAEEAIEEATAPDCP